MSQAVDQLHWTGRTGPFDISVDPGVFAPSHTSRTIADAIEVGPDDTVIDVGCGSGVLSFVAARLGAQRVVGCDISEEAVEGLVPLRDRIQMFEIPYPLRIVIVVFFENG